MLEFGRILSPPDGCRRIMDINCQSLRNSPDYVEASCDPMNLESEEFPDRRAAGVRNSSNI